jgi:hypothetical protein
MKITPVSRLSLLLAALTICAFAQTPDSQPQDTHFTRSFNANSGSALVVENYKGAIHVTGTSSNQVTVTVDKKFEGSDKDRKWWMENTRISFDNESSRVRVKVEYPNNNCILSCSEDEHSDYTAWVELTIAVPRKTNLDIDGYKPDIKLASLDGDIHIKSYKAPIDIASTIGGIEISTYKESVHLHDVSIRGNLRLKMEKGDATIEAKNLGNEADIETGKGNVVIRLPRGAGVTVDYSGNRRSSFHSDLPIASTAGFRSDEMRGTINGGGTQLRLRTDKGSISIERLE